LFIEKIRKRLKKEEKEKGKKNRGGGKWAEK